MRLADCFIEILAYVKLYLRRPGTDYDAFRGRVTTLIEEARLRSQSAGFTNDDYQSALFAVVAWIDEAVMSSDWAGTARWKKELLQQIFFATGRAGIEFFTRLDRLVAHQQAVREVYYFCLMLGFKGRFVTKAQEKTLDDLKQHHVAMLVRDAQHIAVEDAVLFPDAYVTRHADTGAAAAPRPISITTVAVVAGPLAFLLFMYFAYDLVLANMVTSFAGLVK